MDIISRILKFSKITVIPFLILGYMLFGCGKKKTENTKAVKLVIQNNDSQEKVIDSGNSVRVIKENHRPEIITARILPHEPSKRSTLGVNVRASDPENDSIEYEYLWEVNGYKRDGIDTVFLRNIHFSTDDRVRVRVTPKDEHGKGEGLWTQFVIIEDKNEAPVVTSIHISPSNPYKTDVLKAVVKAVDLNKNTINYYYKWLRNGVEIYGADEAVLEDVELNKGDSIAVSVTPYDSYDSGKKYISKPVVILNSPPTVKPPSGGAKIKDHVYFAKIESIDPDGDFLNYDLLKGPAGMTLDAYTGEINWSLSGNKSSGRHKVVVRVSDAEDSYSQLEYNINIAFSE